MAYARKTFKVADVVKTVNGMLQGSTCTPEVREGMIAVLGQILHQTDNYDGFRYLTKSDGVPMGCKVGIEWLDNGNSRTPNYPDDTRRQYGCKSERLELNRKRHIHSK